MLLLNINIFFVVLLLCDREQVQEENYLFCEMFMFMRENRESSDLKEPRQGGTCSNKKEYYELVNFSDCQVSPQGTPQF